MAIGDIWRITPIFLDTANSKQPSIHIDFATTLATDPSLNDVGTMVKNWWDTVKSPGLSAMKTHYNANLSLVSVNLRKIQPLSPLIQTYATGLPILGTGTSDQIEPGAALVLSLRTALSGRSFRGRVYLPAPTETDEDAGGNVPTATAADIRDQWIGGIMNVVNGVASPNLAGQYGVTSAFSGHTLVTHPDGTVTKKPTARGTKILTPITVVKLDRRFRQQKKRQDRRTVYV